MQDASDLEILFHVSDPQIFTGHHVADPDLDASTLTEHNPAVIGTSLCAAARHAPPNTSATWHNITTNHACDAPHKRFAWCCNLSFLELKAARSRKNIQVGTPCEMLATSAPIQDILHWVEKSKKSPSALFQPAFKRDRECA